MSTEDVIFGWLPGVIGELAPPAGDVGTPRTALEHVVQKALQQTPCGIAFSGGLDSSLLLAVATHVARRDGLPDPIPVTRIFPDLAETDESDYQELVIRHLGLTEWRRIALTDDVDIVGPVAQRILLDHGLVWPPALVATAPLLDGLDGGTLLDGEGGDEVLSVAAHRVAAVTSLRRVPRPLRWWRVKASIGAVAPRPVRFGRALRNQREREIPWLRPSARARLDAATAAAQVDTPLSFAASVRRVPRWRGQVLGRRNRRLLAGARGVDLSSPLLDPTVVHALADDGGFLGRGDRRMMLEHMASDLLPSAVWSRPGKVYFNRAYVGTHARNFASTWSGGGVDHAQVDAERLREAWLGERPPSTTGALLQQAWLHTRGGDKEADRQTGLQT